MLCSDLDLLHVDTSSTKAKAFNNKCSAIFSTQSCTTILVSRLLSSSPSQVYMHTYDYMTIYIYSFLLRNLRENDFWILPALPAFFLLAQLLYLEPNVDRPSWSKAEVSCVSLQYLQEHGRRDSFQLFLFVGALQDTAGSSFLTRILLTASIAQIQIQLLLFTALWQDCSSNASSSESFEGRSRRDWHVLASAIL